MRKNLIILILTTVGLYSCGQSNKSISNKATTDIETIDSTILDNTLIKTEGFSAQSYMHTEADYTGSTGKGIIIQNSYPRGGGLIPTPSLLNYGHAVFWSRIINKTDTPLILNLHFPADSFTIVSSPDAHFKLLVPPDTMTLEKVSVFSFGLEGIQAFVNSNFYQPSQLQRTIHPNEDAMFYVILLSHLSQSNQGISRTGLFLDGQSLFYKLTTTPSVSKLLPCGQIVF